MTPLWERMQQAAGTDAAGCRDGCSRLEERMQLAGGADAAGYILVNKKRGEGEESVLRQIKGIC